MPAARQINMIQFFLLAGGLPLVAFGLAFGLVFSIWGIVNVVRVPRPGWILAQAVLSFLPGICAMIGIFLTYQRFSQMAISTVPPKPAEFAAVTGTSMSYGFLGLTSTIVPVFLGLLAFRRWCKENRAVPAMNK